MTDPRCGTYAGYKVHERARTTPCELCRNAARQYLRDYRIRFSGRSLPAGANLGVRHLRVLRMASGGFSTGQIAVRTGSTLDAVKNDLFRIRRVLGASNTVQAVAVAIGLGIIPPADVARRVHAGARPTGTGWPA